MKTETTSGGMGKLILRLILSILLVFSLLGTVGCAVGISVLHSPSQLIAQMHKQNAGQKVYDSLQTRFTTDYNTTAVPANVYMDAISVDWLEQCMEQKLTALYGADSDLLDFSALESSITDYFEQYAEENHYTKDDTYNEKLQETIDNGEKIISDATDLLRKDTLQKAGYLSKLEKLRTLTFAGAGVCGVLTVLLLVLLRPVLGADLEHLELDFDHYQAAVEERQEELADTQTEAMASIIAEQTEAYILDKAGELGLEVTVRVETRTEGNGIPVPWSAELTGSWSQALASALETELGIPAERQVWHEREAEN